MQGALNVSLFVTNVTTVVPGEEEDLESYDTHFYTYFISQEARDFSYAFTNPVYLVTAIFGSVTNFISILIFYRQGIMADSCTPTLTAMAFSDLCGGVNIGITMCISLPKSLGFVTDKYESNHIAALIWPLGQPIRMFLEVSSWTMVYLTVERMVSVVFPFKVKSIITPKRSVIIIACIWLYSFLLRLHVYLMHKYTWRSYENGTVTILRVAKTGLVSEESSEMMSLVNDIPIRLIRITTVVVCNAIIIYKIKKSKKFKDMKANQTLPKDSDGDDSKSKQRKEIKLMRMIVGLSSIYVGCYFPVLIREVLYQIDYKLIEFGFWYDPYWIMDSITDYLEFVNISFNIIIYYTMSSRYKEEFNKLCSCFKRK